MKILFLCNKVYWKTKMSRVRFHAMDALARMDGIELAKDGVEFEGFANVEQSIKKHKPDAIIWYKPCLIPGFNRAKKYGIPLMICYNEMHDRSKTMAEIATSGSTIVICHLGNYVAEYKQAMRQVSFYVVPHCAEKSIFKGNDSRKVYDVLFTGATSNSAYPFRKRLIQIIKELPHCKCKILKHPGYRIENVDSQVREYVSEINKAKVVVTSSSVYKYALAKYIEVGMCGVALCADIPYDRPGWYRKWVVEINSKEEASKISHKIRQLLNSGEWRTAGRRAYEHCKTEVQEKYAARIVEILKNHVR